MSLDQSKLLKDATVIDVRMEALRETTDDIPVHAKAGSGPLQRRHRPYWQYGDPHTALYRPTRVTMRMNLHGNLVIALPWAPGLQEAASAMKDDQDTSRYFSSPAYRIFHGVFGLFLFFLGIYVIFFGVVGLLVRVGAGLLIALLGAEAVWSSLKSRESWLSKLSPFA